MSSSPAPRRYDVLLSTLEVEAPAGEGLADLDRTPEPWESRLQATCECLSWRGTLSNEERRRAEDELGETIYSEFPVHARPAAVTAHALLERGIVSETELQTKMYEVRARLTEA